MKIRSERKDVVVFGGSISGICAAISAARQGSNVALVDKEFQLGGPQHHTQRYPLDFEPEFCFPIGREGGLYEEIMLQVIKLNLEGNYLGLGRILRDLVLREQRIGLFLGYTTIDVTHNNDKNSIESVVCVDQEKILKKTFFRAKYFIDCTPTQVISKISQAVEPIEWTESTSSKDSQLFIKPPTRHAIVISIKNSGEPIVFNPPACRLLQWEKNSIEAKVELLESLKRRLEGDHVVRWQNEETEDLSSEILAWTAWNFLKNLSSTATALENFEMTSFSSNILSESHYRGKSVMDLSYENILSGKQFPDAVAVSRIPLATKQSQLFSYRSKQALPHPFEIPLRSLKSDKIENLFWVGDDALSKLDPVTFIDHLPTLAQMGSATGTAAGLLAKHNRTFRHPSFYKLVRKSLTSDNQQVSLDPISDSSNLVGSAKVSTSSTLQNFYASDFSHCKTLKFFNCLIQIPLNCGKLSKIEILMDIPEDIEVEIRLIEGTSYNSLIPGKCLFSETSQFRASNFAWQTISLDCDIKENGWHFIELKSISEFGIHFQSDAPPGLILHKPHDNKLNKFKHSYSEFIPILETKTANPISPIIKCEPAPHPYDSSNLANAAFRSTSVPNLWISQPTDFKYPEFIELKWDDLTELRQIEITFDSSVNSFPLCVPNRYNHWPIRTLVKDYNIYYLDQNEHSQTLIEVRDNQLSLNSLKFEPIVTRGLEIEILSTHGLNRVQVFQIRVFN